MAGSGPRPVPKTVEGAARCPRSPSPVTYACPSCGTTLESVVDEWRDWRLCPSCGRAGRPPAGRRPEFPDDDLFVVTDAADVAYSPRGLDAVEAGFRDDTTRRVLIGVGFFVAALLSLVSVMQKNPAQAAVFGAIAVLLIFLLARSSATA